MLADTQTNLGKTLVYTYTNHTHNLDYNVDCLSQLLFISAFVCWQDKSPASVTVT